MKNIRRNFVVEYKTSRRQIKTQPTSIWGDMDLKGLVREVESDLPKTGTAISSDPIADRAPAQSAHGRASVAQPEAENITDNAPATISKGAEERSATCPEAEVASGEQPPAPQDIPSSDTQPARGQQVKSQSVETSTPAEIDHDHPNLSSTGQSDPDDELTALEAENRRLKRLMVEKLRAENESLRSMLRRFGVV